MRSNIKYIFTVYLLLNAIAIFGQKAKKPNVVLILADDLGYADVGFNGCKDIPTPNIDLIAKQGVIFTNGYVSYAVCGPSRAGLITGRYQDRFGFGRNPLLAPNDVEMGLPVDEETMADVLKKNGYHNAVLGKWHLGAHPDLYPTKRGFHEFYGFLDGGHHYFPDKLTITDISKVKEQNDGYKTKILRGTTPIEENEYLTDALSREAVDFIGKHHKKPFFLYLAYNAPHTPMQATEKYLSRFNHIKNPKRKIYNAMVSAMDDGIGSVLAELKNHQLEKNTIVIFLSDNGGPEKDNASDNGILRGEKSHFWDGGIKVPFAIRWPAQIKAGTIYDKPVISLDIMATVCEYIKADINPKKPLDGVNLLPYLKSKNKANPHDYLFWRNYDLNMVAIRSADQKLVVSPKVGQELFNIQQDISEQNNLIHQEKSAFDNLLKSWKNWEKQLMNPKFLGLSQDKEYSEKHPDRYKINK